MDISYFDLVVGIIILLLGLKGIINGFFKELFGLIGIIGGIFVASRLGDSVGQLVSDTIFKFESPAAISFIGFLATLIVFWAVMILLGMLLTKLTKASGLGPVDKIFGFIVGSGKFFLIGAVITFAVWNIQAVRVNIEPMMKSSILFPILVESGSIIMKIDPTELSADINDTIDTGIQKSKEQIDAAAEKVNAAVEQKIEESAQEIKDSVSAHIETNTTQGSK